MAFVLDCSVASGWLFKDERSPYSLAAQERLQYETALVPSLFYSETANVLMVGERRARVTRRESEDLMQLLLDLPITTDPSAAKERLRLAWSLARDYRLSVYDATYLELAQRTGLPLATLDEPLRRAATDAGVRIWQP